MDNTIIPYLDPSDAIAAAGRMFQPQSPEELLDLAVGSAVHTAAETFRDVNEKRAEADKAVLEALAEKEGSKAAAAYRQDAAQADAKRMEAFGDTALKVGGGLLAAGFLYALIDALSDL